MCDAGFSIDKKIEKDVTAKKFYWKAIEIKYTEYEVLLMVLKVLAEIQQSLQEKK